MIPSTSACTCCMSEPAARPPATKPSSLVLPLPSSSADFDGSIAWQLASLFKNQIKILSQRDDATRHTGSDHDRCCGGRAPVCRGSKARPELLPLLAGAAEEMGCQRLGCISCKAATAAVAVFFTVCHIVLHGVRSTTLQQLLQHAASSAAVPMCFYFRKCLTARSEAVKQCG